jgi:dTDP-4-dehydrorhamnose reductase
MKIVVLAEHDSPLVPHLQRTMAADEVYVLDERQIDVTSNQCIWPIERLQADVIIHTIESCDVARCEREPSYALKNSIGTQNVARAAKRSSVSLLFLSTAYVFGESRNSGFTEVDAPNPGSAYGRSKLAGERAAREVLQDVFIVRTGWVFGKTHAFWPISPDYAGLPLAQIGNAVYQKDLADAISKLIRSGLYGTYHLASPDYCILGDFIAYAESLVRPELMGHILSPIDPSVVVRGTRGVILRNTIASSQLAINLPGWRSGLEAFTDSVNTTAIDFYA